MTFIAASAVACFLTLIFTPIVRRFAIHLKIGDTANECRKIHKGTIPTLGGIAIFIGVVSAIGFGYGTSPKFAQMMHNGFWAVLLGGGIIFVTGILDDAVNLNFKIKFVLQLLAATLTVLFGGHHIMEIFNPFGQNFVIPDWFGIALTILWIVGICNAVNLIDGLDGLAAGVVGIGSAAMVCISAMYADTPLVIAYSALFGAATGFLRYNFNPAVIFMGDTGALFIGYMMACLPLFHNPILNDDVIWLQLVILGFPVADTLLAPLRRFISGAHPFKADKEHIHHRLMSVFRLTHKATVLRIYAVSSLFGVSAVGAMWLVQKFGETSGILISLMFSTVFVVILVGLRRLGYFTSIVREPAKRHIESHILHAQNMLQQEKGRANPLSLERESA